VSSVDIYQSTSILVSPGLKHRFFQGRIHQVFSNCNSVSFKASDPSFCIGEFLNPLISLDRALRGEIPVIRVSEAPRYYKGLVGEVSAPLDLNRSDSDKLQGMMGGVPA
jgi:hypothetical protein